LAEIYKASGGIELQQTAGAFWCLLIDLVVRHFFGVLIMKL